MKKFFILLVAVIAGSSFSFAADNEQISANGGPTISEASATIVYDGYAYSAAQDGLIPSSDDSVSVYWTNEGCSVNGTSGYIPYKIPGGTFKMMVNGKYKEMTHYVSYKSERYYFQI